MKNNEFTYYDDVNKLALAKIKELNPNFAELDIQNNTLISKEKRFHLYKHNMLENLTDKNDLIRNLNFLEKKDFVDLTAIQVTVNILLDLYPGERSEYLKDLNNKEIDNKEEIKDKYRKIYRYLIKYKDYLNEESLSFLQHYERLMYKLKNVSGNLNPRINEEFEFFDESHKEKEIFVNTIIEKKKKIEDFEHKEIKRESLGFIDTFMLLITLMLTGLSSALLMIIFKI